MTPGPLKDFHITIGLGREGVYENRECLAAHALTNH